MTDRDGDAAPDPLLEEFAFLARSHHRVQLLTHLSREERTRRDIQSATGISQPTLGRILGDFERRRWVSNHHDGAYTLTPLGELLADAVEGTLGVLETIEGLADLEAFLPWDRLEFDHRALSDATVTTPSSSEPLAHMRRFDELAADADAVTVISNVVSCAPADGSTAADREFLADIDELVVTDSVLASGLNDPELREWLHERIEAGDLSLYGHEGEAAFLLGTFDGTVGIVPIDEDGMPRGLVESQAEPIRRWAEDAVAEYRRTATRVRPESAGRT